MHKIGKLHESSTDIVTSYMYKVRIEEGRPVETTHSDACLAVTGYTAHEFANNANLWIRMVLEEDRDLVLQQLEHFFSGHFPQTLQHRITRKDGVVRWVENITIPHHDVNGTLISCDGIVRDITGQKKSEETLAARQAVLQDLADFDAEISHLDPVQLIKSALDFIVERAGTPHVSIAMLEGDRSCFRLFDTRLGFKGVEKGDVLPLASTVLSKVVQQGDAMYRTDIRVRTQDYEVDKLLLRAGIRADFLVPLIADGVCFGTLNCASYEVDGIPKGKRQILQRLAPRLAQTLQNAKLYDSLQESERKYKDLQDASIDGYVWTDMEGHIIEVNDSYKNMMGYSEDELHKLTYKDITPEKWHASEQIILTEQILARGYSDPYEKELIRKDGTIFPVELRAYLIKDAQGNNKGMRAVVRDITERKKAEEKLQEAHDLLEKRVKERTLELFESNAALKVLLKQREQDQTDFENNILSNIKHLIMPYFEKLKRNKLQRDELAYLNIIESNLNEIVSPFATKLSFQFLDFTPREIMIAALIKDGKQDKDIMEILNISVDTVKTHRKNIRKKLGIYGKRINLRTKLLDYIK